MSGQTCPKCNKPVVRRVMSPLAGEARRVEWSCKCEFTVGAAVEWGKMPANGEEVGSFSVAAPQRRSHWRVGPDTFYK